MDKIRIVNWLLTRKCNLKCDYCAIIRNYTEMPAQYPSIGHYMKNQMSYQYVIEVLDMIKAHNPDAFHILYGGEPMLFDGLHHVINHCNDNDIHYTIISNNTPEIQSLIKNLFDKTDYIQGFTSSVDPITDEEISSMKLQRVTKSLEGLSKLKEIQGKGKVKDVVAEITVMKNNLQYLYKLVEHLSKNEINSDITFIDIAKNKFYDFSNIRDKKLLVTKEDAKDVMESLLKSNFNIHMKEVLLPATLNILPSEMDCELEKNVHNISIDADGSLRLCLRIRGILTPTIMAIDIIDRENDFCLSPMVREAIREDKKKYCELCNHTCLLMSKIIDNEESTAAELVHLSRRQGD
jgi:molybdenum cofactor biosynthesis enzyme MoaA